VSADEATEIGARDPLFWCAVGSAAALLLVLAWPLLEGELYVFSDLGRFHVPVRYFYSQALAAGDSFLWFPYEFTGFHLHGEGQGAFAHPLNWIQYRLLSFHAAFSLELMRTYLVLLSGTFALLVRWRVSWAAAAFGAVLFSFGSFNFLHFEHMNFTAIVAHVPWIWFAADVALESPDPRSVVLARLALIGLVASQGLHGHPQAMWMSFVGIAAWASTWLAGGFVTRRERILRERFVALGPLAATMLLGVALAAIQLLPQWDALAISQRADPGSGHANRYALAPINVVQLVAPYLFSGRTVGSNTAGFAFYCGAAVLPLAVWGCLRGRRLAAHWPVLRFGAGLAGFGFVLALGEQGFLYRLQEMLPVVGLFRAPGRYVMLAELGLVLMAVTAFADLASRRDERWPPAWRTLWPLAIPLAIAALVVAVIGQPGVQSAHPAWETGAPIQVAAGVILIAITTALVVAAVRGHRSALFALVVVTAADLGFYGLSYVRVLPTVELGEWAEFGVAPPVGPDQRLEHGPAVFTLRGVRLAGGYAAMTPERVLPIGLGRSPTAAIDPAALRAARRVAGIPVASSSGSTAAALPRVRLVASAEATEDVLTRIGQIDVGSTALVESPVAIGPGPVGEVRVIGDRPGLLRAQTDTVSPQLLVFSERHHPGWRGDRGATPCEVVPVYGDFMGCVVPPGRHDIELRFEPPSFTWGLRVSLIALLVALLWCGAPIIRVPRARS
jgi:hypothetical protein